MKQSKAKQSKRNEAKRKEAKRKEMKGNESCFCVRTSDVQRVFVERLDVIEHGVAGFCFVFVFWGAPWRKFVLFEGERGEQAVDVVGRDSRGKSVVVKVFGVVCCDVSEHVDVLCNCVQVFERVGADKSVAESAIECCDMNAGVLPTVLPQESFDFRHWCSVMTRVV